MWVSDNRLGSLPAPDAGGGLIWLKCQMVPRTHRAPFNNLGSTVHGVVFAFLFWKPQPIEQGTLKNPRNRTRPPRTGCPLTA